MAYQLTHLCPHSIKSFLPCDVSHMISSIGPSSHLTFHVGGVREEGLGARLHEAPTNLSLFVSQLQVIAMVGFLKLY
jgi:hypothetical protein